MKNYSKKRPEYYTNHYLNHKEEYKDYNERRRELHRREPRIRMFQGLKRRAKRKDLISSERLKKLERIGFDWHVRKSKCF